MSVKPKASVIVPVYEHWHLVPELVQSLARQTVGTDAFELIVVDNGSRHVPDPSNDPPFMRRLFCAKAGSYAARNVGVAVARADTLFFTDADCRADMRWLEAGLGCAAENPDLLQIVAGHVHIDAAHMATLTNAALYDSVMGFPQERYVRRGYGVTANLLVPRAVFESVGLFDEQRFSGGDAEFCRRAARYGARVIFCGDAVVVHPARESMEELITKVKRIKGGQIRSGSWRRRLLYLAFTFTPPLRAWNTALRARRFGWRARIKVCVIQAWLWLVGIFEAVRLLAGGAAERR